MRDHEMVFARPFAPDPRCHGPGVRTPVVAPALPRGPARADRVSGGSRASPGISRYLGAAAALHVLGLLAGARAGLGGHPAKLPAEPTETTPEVGVDIVRADPESDMVQSHEEPPAAAVQPQGGAGRRAGGARERHSASKPRAPEAPSQRADEPARIVATPSPAQVALPGEQSGALEVLSNSFRRISSDFPVPPATGDNGAGLAGEGAGLGDGTGTGGKKSGKPRGGRGWGESWDYVAGPSSREVERPASFRDIGKRADESTLPIRTIHTVVGASSGRLRSCDIDGRRRDPTLAGRILVRFAVDPRGRVIVASDGGTTVADPAVIRCVLGAFAAMTFPARPQGGAVWTTYLVTFPPGT